MLFFWFRFPSTLCILLSFPAATSWYRSLWTTFNMQTPSKNHLCNYGAPYLRGHKNWSVWQCHSYGGGWCLQPKNTLIPRPMLSRPNDYDEPVWRWWVGLTVAPKRHRGQQTGRVISQNADNFRTLSLSLSIPYRPGLGNFCNSTVIFRIPLILLRYGSCTVLHT